MSNEIVGTQFVVGDPVPAGGLLASDLPERVEYSYETILRMVEKYYPDDTAVIGAAVHFHECPLAVLLRYEFPSVMGVVHQGVVFDLGGTRTYRCEFGSELAELVTAIDMYGVNEAESKKGSMDVTVAEMKMLLRRRIGG